MTDKKNRRSTRQRSVILEELRKTRTHPTAVELHESARRRLPKISLGTVYRNLELLTQMGVIRKLAMGGSQARFDGNLERHYHVRCLSCGRVDDIHGLPADLAEGSFSSLNDYDIIGHQLGFVGLCPICKANSADEDVEDAPREPQ